VGRPPGRHADDHGEVDLRDIRITRSTTEAVRRVARQHQLTLNTIVQGAWTLLLGRYTGEEDIVFGATVSGRPPELEDVESMVGLFINTLPVRESAARPSCPRLKALQTNQSDARRLSTRLDADSRMERGAARCASSRQCWGSRTSGMRQTPAARPSMCASSARPTTRWR
jgi:hypothetical protein